MSPKVSVVMSVLNGEAFLRPAVDSVLHQTFPDLELIVIDNASTDGTASILDSYDDPRIVRLNNEQVLTLTQSLNLGLKTARGDYVARLDADDVALPERFAKQVAFLDAHPEVTLLATGWLDLMHDGRLVERPVPPPSRHEDLLQAMAAGNCIIHSSLMYRRVEVSKAGGYPTDFAFAQDYALYLHLLKTGHRLSALPESLVQLRHHLQQFSTRPETALLRAVEEERLLESAAILPGLDRQARERNQRMLVSVRAHKAQALLRGGHKGEALWAAFSALATHPPAFVQGVMRSLLAPVLRKIG
jgi:hypothetical protein